MRRYDDRGHDEREAPKSHGPKGLGGKPILQKHPSNFPNFDHGRKRSAIFNQWFELAHCNFGSVHSLSAMKTEVRMFCYGNLLRKDWGVSRPRLQGLKRRAVIRRCLALIELLVVKELRLDWTDIWNRRVSWILRLADIRSMWCPCRLPSGAFVIISVWPDCRQAWWFTSDEYSRDRIAINSIWKLSTNEIIVFNLPPTGLFIRI